MQYSCLHPSTIESNATLVISDGGLVQVTAAYDPFTDQTDPQKHVTVLNYGLFEIYDGGTTIAVASIAGDGNTIVHNNAHLEVDSIFQNSLTLSPGAELDIRPIAGGSPLVWGDADFSTQPVPEPSALVLAGMAMLTWGVAFSKKRQTLGW